MKSELKSKIKTFTILSTLTIITLHIINRISYSLATLKGVLCNRENNYYEWRFGKVRYTKKGSGSPILLIHDLTIGSCGYEFHKIENELSKTNEVYTIDLLGYGLSDKVNLTYTNFLYVQLITDFIKNIIGKKTDVITSGDSSSIAIMTCHNNPDVINKMIFINPQNISLLNKIPSKRTKLLKLLIEFPIIGTFIFNIISSKSSITNKFKQEYFYENDFIKNEYINAYSESAHNGSHHSKYVVSSYLGKYMNINIMHALNEIDYSISIIAGKEKNNIESIVDTYLNNNGAIEVSYIKNTKQLPHLERPEDVIKQIQMYFS